VAELLALINPNAIFAPGALRLHERRCRPCGRNLFRDWTNPGSGAFCGVVFFMSLLDLYFLAQLAAHRASTTSRASPPSVNNIRRRAASDRIDATGRRRSRRSSRSAASSDRFSFRGLALGYFSRFSPSGPSVSSTFDVFVTWRSLLAGFLHGPAANRRQCSARGFYPPSVRSTGVGWALGIGRVGSIVGLLVGGALMTAT